MDESALQPLGQISTSLKTLVIAENPVVETIGFRIRLLVMMLQLERLDKDPVTPEERAEARDRIRVRSTPISSVSEKKRSHCADGMHVISGT